MTNAELRRAMMRLDDAKATRAAEVAAAARPPVSAAQRLGAPFAVGDRVQDIRGGKEGTVVDVGPSDRTGAVLLDVRFDDGSFAVRPPSDLIARPTPPAASR